MMIMTVKKMQPSDDQPGPQTGQLECDMMTGNLTKQKKMKLA